MVCKITKVEPASFVGSDGNQVNGHYAYVVYQIPDRFFISSKMDVSELKEGLKFDFDFNNKGKLLSFTKV